MIARMTPSPLAPGNPFETENKSLAGTPGFEDKEHGDQPDDSTDDDLADALDADDTEAPVPAPVEAPVEVEGTVQVVMLHHHEYEGASLLPGDEPFLPARKARGLINAHYAKPYVAPAAD